MKKRFSENKKGFFEENKKAIYFIVLAAFLDAFSTFCFMYVLGVESEFHPMVRYISSHFGEFIGPFAGGAAKIGLGFCALIYLGKYQKAVLVSAGIFYCYAFMHNMIASRIFDFF